MNHLLRIVLGVNVLNGFEVTEFLKNNETRSFKIAANVYCSNRVGRLAPIRTIRWRATADGVPLVQALDKPAKVYATLIQSRGTRPVKGPCGNCAGRNGHFAECVLAMRRNGKHFGGGGCANCFWEGTATLCSYSKSGITRNRAKGPRRRSSPEDVEYRNTQSASAERDAATVVQRNTAIRTQGNRTTRAQLNTMTNIQRNTTIMAQTNVVTAVQRNITLLDNPEEYLQDYVSSVPFNDPQAIRNELRRLGNAREQLDKVFTALEHPLVDLETESAGWKRYLN